jgi:hypothetical protein
LAPLIFVRLSIYVIIKPVPYGACLLNRVREMEAMTMVKTSCLLATVLVLGSSAGTLAQGTGDTGGAANSQKTNTDTGMGGNATSGTGVRTGKGPLSKPIPPATSTTNPQQNPQRPQNTQGPAQTNPPQQPFGSR